MSVKRNLVLTRKLFYYISENKATILSILMLIAIIKDVVWYGCFGINILAFSSIQDLSTSLITFSMNIIMPLILFYIVIQFLSIMDANKIKNNYVLLILIAILILFAMFFFYTLFKRVLNPITIIFSFQLILALYSSKNTPIIHAVAIVSISLYITYFQVNKASEITSFYQSSYNREIEYDSVNINSNTELYSFTYNNLHVDTTEPRFYLIGDSQLYFFIYDYCEEGSLIIPKKSCLNITVKTDYGIQSLVKLFSKHSFNRT